MKSQLLSIVVGLGLVFNSFAANEKPMKTEMVDVMVDLQKSDLTWLGKKVTGEHTGKVKFKEAKLTQNPTTQEVLGEIVIDLSTITSTDVTDPEYNQKLVGHLKGEDFFYVEKFPTATFKIKSFQMLKDSKALGYNAIAKGDLTIRGKTQAHEAKVNYVPSADGFAVTGKLEIDRTKFDVKYNSKKFFSVTKLGDKMINDVFSIDLNVIAKNSPKK